jgi:hypothetical protein
MSTCRRIYLQYLVERVNHAGPAHTYLSDLQDIGHLSMQDSESYTAASTLSVPHLLRTKSGSMARECHPPIPFCNKVAGIA